MTTRSDGGNVAKVRIVSFRSAWTEAEKAPANIAAPEFRNSGVVRNSAPAFALLRRPYLVIMSLDDVYVGFEDLLESCAAAQNVTEKEEESNVSFERLVELIQCAPSQKDEQAQASAQERVAHRVKRIEKDVADAEAALAKITEKYDLKCMQIRAELERCVAYAEIASKLQK